MDMEMGGHTARRNDNTLWTGLYYVHVHVLHGLYKGDGLHATWSLPWCP